MSKLPMTEADLQACVDGQLPEARRAEVEVYLAARPEEAERIAAYRRQNEELRALFDPVVNEPIPARLSSQPRHRSLSLQRYAAVAAFAFISGSVGWMLRSAVEPSAVNVVQTPGAPQPYLAQTDIASLPHQAAIAHVVYSPDVRHPVEIGADQEDQLVTWLSKRLGAQLKPPKLGPLGFELIGGRLLPGNEGPVAQFMYHDASGQRLTLYVTTEHKSQQNTAFRFSQEGPVNVFYWVDGQFGYAISAGIDKGKLVQVAQAVYDQINPK